MAKQKKKLSESPAALQVVAAYVQAMKERDSDQMIKFRAADFVLDWVHGDAFEDGPLSGEDTEAFWPAWFAGFPELDYEITRTVAAETVVVTQWVFTGTHTQPLGSPIFDPPIEGNGRTIRFRGVSVYDVADKLIQRETTYLDLATFMVELGIEL
ncbi:MAG: ester cyclase [Chloroflexi bacterium]|nr:ester cyclase [Chloroflexota bacterium]